MFSSTSLERVAESRAMDSATRVQGFTRSRWLPTPYRSCFGSLSRALREARRVAAAFGLGVKRLASWLVLGDRNRLVRHRPFVMAEDAVAAPRSFRALHSVAVDLHDDHRRHRIEDRPLDVEHGPAVLGLHRDGRLVREAICSLRRVAHRREREPRARLVEEREIQLARLARDAPLSLLIDERVAAHVPGARGARLAAHPAEWRRSRSA